MFGKVADQGPHTVHNVFFIDLRKEEPVSNFRLNIGSYTEGKPCVTSM